MFCLFIMICVDWINDYPVLYCVWPAGAHMRFFLQIKVTYVFARLLINSMFILLPQISLNLSSPWVDVVCSSAVWAPMLVKETWRSSLKVTDAFGRLTWKTGLALWWALTLFWGSFVRGDGEIFILLPPAVWFSQEFDDHRDADDAVYELNGKELCSERWD